MRYVCATVQTCFLWTFSTCTQRRAVKRVCVNQQNNLNLRCTNLPTLSRFETVNHLVKVCSLCKSHLMLAAANHYWNCPRQDSHKVQYWKHTRTNRFRSKPVFIKLRIFDVCQRFVALSSMHFRHIAPVLAHTLCTQCFNITSYHIRIRQWIQTYLRLFWQTVMSGAALRKFRLSRSGSSNEDVQADPRFCAASFSDISIA